MNPMKSISGARTSRSALLIGTGMVLGAAVFGGVFDRATAQDPAPDSQKAIAAAGFSTEQKAGIEAIVREYLLANPEILFEVQNRLEAKMEKQQGERLKTAIKENSKELYHRVDAPTGGNPDGDIAVVEFFDYNCGFCKRGFEEVVKLIENDKKVRVVFKELPILSKGSEDASRVALAAKQQGKYWEVHRALLEHKGSVDGESSLRIAGKLGLDVEKLKADMQSDAVTGEIDKVRELAQKMGINGTPHFLVGDRTIAGAPENLFEQLEGHLKDLREKGCEVC